MQCEMCGKPATGKAIVEGVTMQVCATCASFGNKLDAPRQAPNVAHRAAEPLLSIVDDAGTRVKRAREQQGLAQKDFALRISEHQSVLQHIETGKQEPSLELARKLEKALHITLVEETAPITLSTTKSPSTAITIGDLLKLKSE
ncbi:TIGR00270 family protein [Candidatus Woesearchaeota archaeon]|nr:TIGR00270 family protein [Candidatus Woesearchaeota archaeon]